MGASMVSLNAARSLAKGITNLEIAPYPAGLWKWSKESPYYVVTAKGVFRCQICPNRCTLKEGEESVCRARTVSQGKLFPSHTGTPVLSISTRSKRNPCFIFSLKAGVIPLQLQDAHSPA